MGNDTIIMLATCPKCRMYRLKAFICPSDFDEDGHADGIEVESITCTNGQCGYEPEIDDPLWEYAEKLAYDFSRLVQTGIIYEEIK